MMFSLSFVEGSKSAEGVKRPLADMDRGFQIEGGPNPLGHRALKWVFVLFYLRAMLFKISAGLFRLFEKKRIKHIFVDFDENGNT